MQFVTWAEMTADATELGRMYRGRDIHGVVAIPRSGYFPAAIVAQILGVPLVGLDHFAQHGFHRSFAVGRMADVAPPGAGRVLVIDDSVHRGAAFDQAKRVVDSSGRWQAIYAALYGCDETPETGRPDVLLRSIPRPRLFAWNWLGHGDLARTLFDFDGVFCPDGPADEAPEYGPWLAGAPALHIPTVPIRGIVTHRLEPWRETSRRWLEEHGIKFGTLNMHPGRSADERRRSVYGEWKGRIYEADEGAMLFVESSATQAKIIAAVSKKPVLCTADWAVYPGA